MAPRGVLKATLRWHPLEGGCAGCWRGLWRRWSRDHGGIRLAATPSDARGARRRHRGLVTGPAHEEDTPR